MSQHVRRTFAALGLMAALLFAAPLPSRAAGLWELPAMVPGIAVRVRSWLEGWWLPAPRRAHGPKQGSGVDPNGTTTSTTTTDQGSGVDPNGTK